MIHDGAEISNFAILIKRAITIDDKLYFRAMERNLGKNIQGRAKYTFNSKTYGRTPSYPQKNPIKLNNLQVTTAKKEKKKGKDRKPIFNYYAYRKPGHIARNYKLKNKMQ